MLTNHVAAAEIRLRAAVPEELTLFPRDAMPLRFVSEGDGGWDFLLVRPGEPRVFTERDGYLESSGTPVILLPDHRKPPPLDRRWETYELLRRALIDTRPVLHRVLWIVPPDSPLPRAIQPLLSRSDALRLPEPDHIWFRVHAPLCADSIPAADFMVVEIDPHDLDRGVSTTGLLIKWQFVLQHLQARSGASKGLLFGPPLEGMNPAVHALLTESLQSLARSHNLRYVDRSLAESVWRERLFHALQREIRLP